MPVTTQLQPQHQSTVTGATYSGTLAQGSGSANPTRVDTFPSTAPVPVLRRFNGFRSLVQSNVAIPAMYGFVAPLIGSYFHVSRPLLFGVLPACLIFALGSTRKKKRAGLLTGAIFGAITCAAAIVEGVLHGDSISLTGMLFTMLQFFTVLGAVLGTLAAGIRRGAEWLFGSNQP